MNHKNTFHSILPVVAILITANAGAAVTDDGLAAHWLFDKNHIQGQEIRDNAGESTGAITGPVVLQADNHPEAILLDRDRHRIDFPYAVDSPSLPSEAITVETWISVERTAEWCNIISAIGGERGWALGFRQSSFSFGVATKDKQGKEGKITYVRARPSLQWGKWTHVAGTFDGATVKVYVDGRLEKSADVPPGKINYPSKGAYTIGVNGSFYFRGLLHEARVYNRALSNAEIQANFEAKQGLFPELLAFAVPPTLERTDNRTAVITWETKSPSPSTVSFGDELPLRERFGDTARTTSHRVTIENVESRRIYYYRIQGQNAGRQKRSSRLYEYDSTFDYSPVQVVAGPSPFAEDALTPIYERAADRILEAVDGDRGYALVLGCGEGRLMYELAKRSGLRLVGIDEDPENVQRARRALDKAGVYGVRATVRQGSLSQLPFASYCANLIVSDTMLTSGTLPGNALEVQRVLRPSGGIAYLGQAAGTPEELMTRSSLNGWLERGGFTNAKVSTEDGLWAVIEREPLPGGGEWSHQYADAGNSANSRDQYRQDPMGVLWFGRPGPRPMVDRGTRAPAPLSVNGRIYIQGDRKLFGLDAYNGTMLWAKEIPDLRRANMPRDCGNMAADDGNLYLAIKDACWTLDGQSGERMRAFHLTEEEQSENYDWGYLARVENLILGSGVRRGGMFIGADGEWYDRSDEESDKVISDFLFALDRETGKRIWTYRDGAVINPTLCYGDGRLYFIESRNPEALALKTGRIGREVTKDEYLVALDAETGQTIYEHPVDLGPSTWILYLLYSDGHLAALSTSDKYHMFGFEAKTGTQLWKQEYAFVRTHHGGAMNHPAIINGVVYAEPAVVDLVSGEKSDIELPERQKCGAIAGTMNYIFGRHHYHSMYDLETNERVEFTGVRSGCWLGIIPAGGIILAPESSAGCHCTHPIQTSLALISKHDRTSHKITE